MLTFEVINELTLKVTCEGSDTLIAKAGAFIAGENSGAKNYTFEKMLLGPGGSIGQALFGQLVRRVTGENIPLMKVNMTGNSTTYYANYGQHVVVYKLEQGETVSVESENILAFTNDCDYSVRFLGIGVLSQKGLATTTLVGRGNNAYVALLSDGNPLVERLPRPCAGKTGTAYHGSCARLAHQKHRGDLNGDIAEKTITRVGWALAHRINHHHRQTCQMAQKEVNYEKNPASSSVHHARRLLWREKQRTEHGTCQARAHQRIGVFL